MTGVFPNNKCKMKRLPSMMVAAAFMILFLTAAAACVRNGEPEDCEYPLRLHFSYTYNREDRDLFAEEVPAVSLHLFDAATGEYVKHVELAAGDLGRDATYVWKAPKGKFTLVSWGGIEMRYRVESAENFDTHKVSLPADEDGNVAHKREHLWHNVTTGIVIDGDISPEIPVDLHKISNDLTVTVGMAGGSRLAEPVKSKVVSANTLYSSQGRIHADAREVTYLPDETAEATRATHTYTLLGLSRGDSSKLSVEYGANSIYDGSLTEMISKQPDIIYDLDDDFHLDFEVSDINGDSATVSVSVNGWHVVDYDVKLY